MPKSMYWRCSWRQWKKASTLGFAYLLRQACLMDESCSALDPIATAKIEALIDESRVNYTIAIVTHSMQQTARVSQRTAYFHLGKLIEVGETDQIFTNPSQTH